MPAAFCWVRIWHYLQPSPASGSQTPERVPSGTDFTHLPCAWNWCHSHTQLVDRAPLCTTVSGHKHMLIHPSITFVYQMTVLFSFVSSCFVGLDEKLLYYLDTLFGSSLWSIYCQPQLPFSLQWVRSTHWPWIFLPPVMQRCKAWLFPTKCLLHLYLGWGEIHFLVGLTYLWSLFCYFLVV